MTAPLQFEIEHAERDERVRQTLPLPFALIGRDERADLRLTDKRVSHRHAYLQVVAGRLWYVDLDSRVGTLREDGRSAQAPLDPGQRLRIGPYFIRLTGGGQEAVAGEIPLPNPLSSDSFDSSTGPAMALDFLEGAAKQPLWVINRPLTLVGRGDSCKIRLHSPTVSRTHCALLHTPAGLWAIDLLGRDGIAVNGAPVRWALLADADELRIGQFVIRVCRRDRSAPEPRKSLALTLHQPPQTSLEEICNAARELAPSPSAVATTAEASLIPSLVSQFGLMQQQMFDQFQQVLMTIVQTFGNLHRDQLQIVQREIDQLRELTRELQGVQSKLARQAETRSTDIPRPLSLLQSSAPAIPAPRRGMGPTHAAPAPTSPARPRVATETVPAAPAASTLPSPESTLQSDTEVHAWLNQRLSELQQERQSRWQKILQVVTGK